MNDSMVVNTLFRFDLYRPAVVSKRFEFGVRRRFSERGG